MPMCIRVGNMSPNALLNVVMMDESISSQAVARPKIWRNWEIEVVC
jgi:hypothetical protein